MEGKGFLIHQKCPQNQLEPKGIKEIDSERYIESDELIDSIRSAIILLLKIEGRSALILASGIYG